MFMIKLSAPLVAAMKALRNTSGVKKPSEDDWLLLCQWIIHLSGWAPFRVYR